jgi:hypothetical protein
MSILQLGSDTLAGTPGAGQLEYNGQFYGTDSNASRGQLERLVQGTAVASTSGTSIDFTGIPAWAKRITVMFNGVSLSATANLLIQIGNGSPEVTGYLSASSFVSTVASSTSATNGFIIQITAAAGVIQGSLILTLFSGNTWVANGVVARSDQSATTQTGGSKTTSAAVDRVRITTTTGTDTFDAGSINIMYEG